MSKKLLPTMVNVFDGYERNATDGNEEEVKELLSRLSGNPLVIEAEALLEYLKENGLVKTNTSP